jgi:hypothetical protein
LRKCVELLAVKASVVCTVIPTLVTDHRRRWYLGFARDDSYMIISFPASRVSREKLRKPMASPIPFRFVHTASRSLRPRLLSSTASLCSADQPPKPPRPIDDSTSALDYKRVQRTRPPPLPAMDLPRSRTAEEAVTNILYNTPPPSLQPFKKSVTWSSTSFTRVE